MKKMKLEEMVSQRCYDEIVSKVKTQVGDKSFDFIFPSVKKALEEGSGEVREQILIEWLNCDTCRVCSHCGSIMEEGWYLGLNGYACSDKCCMKIMGIKKKEYDRYSIYLDDIKEYLDDEGEGRKPEDLTEEEIDEITSSIVNGLDEYYYTEWC